MKSWIFTCFMAMLVMSSCSVAENPTTDEIDTLFVGKKDRHGQSLTGADSPYEISLVRGGAFTAPDKREAIVGFSYTGDELPHPERGNSIWLLSGNTDWKIVREVGFFVDDGFRCYSDITSEVAPFETVDFEKDGRKELIVTYGYQGGGGGESHEYGQVMALTADSNRVLFDYTSFDYSGISVIEPVPESEEKGIARVCHELRLEDMDGDGLPELIDMEETEIWYRSNYDDIINRWFEVDSSQTVLTEHVYKLHNGAFSLLDSEVKRSVTKSFAVGS